MKKFFTLSRLNIFIFCIFLGFLAQITFASDLKIKNNAWKDISDICGVKKVGITRISDNGYLNLFLLKFNPRKINIKILISSKFFKKISDASFLANKTGAFCVINGGFFDKDYNPLGVLITGGEILQYMPQGGYFSIFCIKNEKPQIIHMKDFAYDGVTEAIQCSPRLIVNGINTKGVYGLNAISRRSGIGLDYNGFIVIYATDTAIGGLSFAELRDIFRLPDINLKTVLSLDGGASTQLYFKLNNKVINIQGFEDVPVAIGFFLK